MRPLFHACRWHDAASLAHVGNLMNAQMLVLSTNLSCHEVEERTGMSGKKQYSGVMQFHDLLKVCKVRHIALTDRHAAAQPPKLQVLARLVKVVACACTFCNAEVHAVSVQEDLSPRHCCTFLPTWALRILNVAWFNP